MRLVLRGVAPFFIAMCVVAGVAGCGSHGTPMLPGVPVKPTGVIFSAQPPTSLALNASATIDAVTLYATGSAANTQNTQVTYAVSCGTANGCGALNASPLAGAVNYTAPAATPSGGTVTVTATSVANPALSVSATIKIVPPIPINVTFFAPPPASLELGANVPLRAQITNDVSANPEVNWTVTCGGTACGSFSPTTTVSEAATTYTVPSAIPGGGTVTVTATSVTDPTQSISANIAIAMPGPMLADGTYVFQLSGPSSASANFVTGAFAAKGGAIVGGEQDAIFNDSENGPYSNFQQITGGNYTTSPDGNLQISLQLPLNGVETLNGTLTSGGHGFIGGIDGVIGNGTLELQTGTAAPSGGYAFLMGPGDLYNSSPSIGGILNVDSAGGISGEGSMVDVSFPLSRINGAQTLAASTVSTPDAYGRVMFQLNPGTNSTLSVLDMAGYMVDAAHIRIDLLGDPNNGNSVVGESGGIALGQGANTGKFSEGLVAGSSYVFGAAGNDQNGTLQLAGLLTFHVGGGVSGMLNWNDLTGKTPQGPLAFTGTYTIDSDGALTLSNLSDGTTFNYALHLYLDGNGGGVVLSNDVNDVFAGRAYRQQGSAFTAGSFSGSYGLNASLFQMPPSHVPQTGTAVGPVTVTAGTNTNSLSGIADNGNGGANYALTGSFTPGATGVFEGTIAGFDSANRNAGSTFTLYLVDGTQGVAIETDNSLLTLGRLALAQ